MLRFFRSITTDEAQQQSTAALKCSAEQQRQASQLQQKAELLKRGPGRPKKLTDAHHVLEMAAAAATSKEEDAAEPAEKRGKYANWFASVYIHNILHAVQRTGSARKAVEWLQRSFPQLLPRAPLASLTCQSLQYAVGTRMASCFQSFSSFSMSRKQLRLAVCGGSVHSLHILLQRSA